MLIKEKCLSCKNLHLHGNLPVSQVGILIPASEEEVKKFFKTESIALAKKIEYII